jgi:hypothetical protein
MPYRSISLNGEQRQCDVVTGTMTVQTPWSIIAAQAGDVLVPWGNTVVPIPSGLLDQLEVMPPLPEPVRIDSDMDVGRSSTQPADDDPTITEIRRMKKDELIGYAEALGVAVDDDMTRDDLIEAILAARSIG